MANNNNRCHDRGPSQQFRKSALMLAMLCGTQWAMAQENSAGSEQEIETIEVRGIRASMAENLAIKRLSNAIVDAITAEDIGKFPDKNVADSLQRVPGVVISRSGGEGENVSIRGLSSDLTFTQLNGNFIASSAGSPSRSFSYSLLPATMVQSVEVFKSSEARLDEGGVGGTVILHSRKPLDMEANSGALNIEYTYADVTEEYEPNFSGVYSWKNEHENLGLLVGYSKQDRTNRALGGDMSGGGGWRWATSSQLPATDTNGTEIVDSTRRFSALEDAYGNVYDGVWAPQVAGVGITKEKREREGLQVTIQWRPMNDLSLTMNHFHFELGQNRTTSQMWIPEWKYHPNYLTDVTVDDTQTIVTGMDFTSGAGGVEGNLEFPWLIGSYTVEKDTSDTYDLAIEYVGDVYELTGKFGHTQAHGGPSESWSAAYKSGQPASRSASGLVENAASFAGWRLGDRVSLYADPALLSNLQAGVAGDPDPGSTGSSFVVSDLEEDYAQLDLDYHVDFGIIDTLRVGGKYRKANLHRETNNTFFITQAGAQQIASGELDPFSQGAIDNVSYQWIGAMPALEQVLNSHSEQNIPGGFEVNTMPTINWDKYRQIVTNDYVKHTRKEPDFVFDIEEKITAAYVQADFSFSDFRGNLGVRYVQTQTQIMSSDKINYFLDDINDATEEDILGNERLVDVETMTERTVTDTQLLPSLNLVWDASDNLVMRGALARTMSRPPFNDMGAPEQLTFISQEWADDRLEFRGNPVEPGWQGSGGNKALKPFESTQMDLSAEYYYGNGSALGIAVFNKKVDNFIVPLIITSTRPFEGFTNPFTGVEIVPSGNITVAPFTTNANGTNATSRGIELFAQHAFDNGFGINVNYTLNDTNQADINVDGEKVGESALVGSADNQFNFSGYYENEHFSVRASYNRRGETALGLADGLNVYQEPYQQVDVNVSYNVMKNLILSASIINLTKEEPRTFYGDDSKARLRSSSYTGQRYYAGLTYRF
ncbi:Vitamin B12 transporter BtuB [Pseudoalteromonas holothuriae]|uniref:Vitamin B12 transporter BtuB n=1 Tax=Pseudoalteromonas holothuriae TaxID=2963714 RepID=A0A9W4QRX5_9GAMM|nr:MULTISPECIES: TonB-dependent receptor [unclassified Pseudoalteromonas]CAH9050525.1 Vitamin B12 transporter BtuB [Pseudoalteromonas sp. CIP111854]CAH9059519.1 Vitamin B12 transporter BtuB [Pseudoalteromonas sp. CIP111951]